MQTGRCLLTVCLAVPVFLPGAARAEVEHEYKDGKWVPVTRPAEGTVAGELALIRQYVDRGRGRKAVRAVKKFLNKHLDGPAREEAMMLAGQAELDRGRYYQAFEWYETQIGRFPNGRWLARALSREYEIAEAFLAGKKRILWGFLRVPARDAGLEILSRIAKHDPGSDLAKKALIRIGDYHYSRQEWFDAVDGYDHYLELYKGSDPSGTTYAMAQAAQATYASFNGIEFDETPLLEADQRFREFLRDYPLAASRAGAEAMLREIYETRAAKVLSTAQFYQRTGRPKAAKLYYRRVIEEFPNASCAAAARDRFGPAAPSRSEKPAARQSSTIPTDTAVELESLVPSTKPGDRKK